MTLIGKLWLQRDFTEVAASVRGVAGERKL